MTRGPDLVTESKEMGIGSGQELETFQSTAFIYIEFVHFSHTKNNCSLLTLIFSLSCRPSPYDFCIREEATIALD
jgi:hypothetical protein